MKRIAYTCITSIFACACVFGMKQPAEIHKANMKTEDYVHRCNNGELQCTVCNTKRQRENYYLTSLNMYSHIQSAHLCSPNYACPYCNYTYATRARVKEHIAAKHAEKSGNERCLRCPYDACEEAFTFYPNPRNNSNDKRARAAASKLCSHIKGFHVGAEEYDTVKDASTFNLKNPGILETEKERVKKYVHKLSGGRFQCTWTNCNRIQSNGKTESHNRTSLIKHIQREHLHSPNYRCPYSNCTYTNTLLDNVKYHLTNTHYETMPDARCLRCHYCRTAFTFNSQGGSSYKRRIATQFVSHVQSCIDRSEIRAAENETDSSSEEESEQQERPSKAQKTQNEDLTTIDLNEDCESDVDLNENHEG